MKVSSFIIFSILATFALNAEAAKNKEKLSLSDIKDISNKHNVIYGEDDRHNLFDYEDTIVQTQAKSIAMKIHKKRLIQDRNDPSMTYVPHVLLENRIGALCKDEAFAQEVSVGDCTGFLVTPDILLTASHCIPTEKDCFDNKWIFNHNSSSSDIETKNIYSCKELITSKTKNLSSKDHSSNEANVYIDYALVKLDRQVEGHVPLEIRTSGFVRTNTPLYAIGHPMGLATKVTAGAKVISGKLNRNEKEAIKRAFPGEENSLRVKLAVKLASNNYFKANLDAYVGNSGSPVFNQKTGKVEGIIIQGVKDFDYNYERDCLESVRLPDNQENASERVMKITKIPELKKLLKK